MNHSGRLVHTNDLSLPDLQPFRTLRWQDEHRKMGIVVAEGKKVVQRAFESGLDVPSLLATLEQYEMLRAAVLIPETTSVFIAEKDTLQSIAGFRLHQGIMATVRIPREHTLEQVMRTQPQPRLFVALDGLAHAENVGVIVRNCAAFGVQAVIVGERTCSPYLRRAVRNSMGTVFRVPVHHTDDLAKTLGHMKTVRDMNIIAGHPHTPSALDTVDFRGDVCVVFGSEDAGISEAVLALRPLLVSIPMANDIDSLNVANASAAFLYEIQRQRRSSAPVTTASQPDPPNSN